MKKVVIPVQDFSDDTSFRFSSSIDMGPLKKSVQISGILTPVFVQKTGEKYKLLSGFKRFAIAKEMHPESIPAFCIENEPLDSIFYEILLEQRIYAPFNLIEKSKILQILNSLGEYHDVPFEEFLILIDIPNVPSLIEEVMAFVACHPVSQQYMEKFQVSLKQAVLFQDLSYEEQALFAQMGIELQIRAVELTSIMRMFFESCKRDNKLIADLWNELKLPDLLKNNDLNRNEKIDIMKKRLSFYRYPKLQTWNQALEETSRTMQLPDFVSLRWDKQLEAPGVNLHADLETEEQAKLFSKWVARSNFLENLKKMFGIV